MTISTQLGPYRIERLLGEGGMAGVYLVWHTDLHRREALKLLPPHLAHDRSFVERFLTEARTAARLRHRSIATIHTVSSADAPQPYFTMELVEGGDLADYLAAKGRLPLQEAIALLAQIADALDYAHQQGVIHRDIKPANVLLDRSGGDLLVKVVDFGIARAQEQEGGTRLTRAGMIVGTPEYMSPEQAGSGSVVDGRTDQYALGVLAYEMLCGTPPFRAEAGSSAISVIMRHLQEVPRSVSTLSGEVSEGVSAAVLKALSKRPEDRYGSCREFVAALAAGAVNKSDPRTIGVALPVKALSGSQASPKVWGNGSRGVMITLAVIVAVGLGLIAVALNRPQTPDGGSHLPDATGSSRSTSPTQSASATAGAAVGRQTNSGAGAQPMDGIPAPTGSASSGRGSTNLPPADAGETREIYPPQVPSSESALGQKSPAPVDLGSHIAGPMEIQWDRYTDVSSEYHIDYPKGWTVTRAITTGRSRTTFTSPLPGISLVVEAGPTHNSDPLSGWRSMDSEFRSHHKERYKFVSLERTSESASSPALWTFILALPGSLTVQKSDFGVVKGNRGYAVLVSAPPDMWSAWEPNFKHIRESFDVYGAEEHPGPTGQSPDHTPDVGASVRDYPEVSQRRLTNADLAVHTDAELRIMINTMYALHGLIFHKSPEMRAYFEAKNWYHGDCLEQNNVYDRFSMTEKKNAELINNYRKAHPASQERYGD